MIHLDEAQAKLRGTEELLENVFASIHTLMTYLDSNLNVVWINNAFADLMRRDSSDLVQRPHDEVFPDGLVALDLERILATGNSLRAYDERIAFDTDRETTFWDVTVQPVKNGDERVDGLLLTLVNVTERKATEEALRRSERRRRIIDSERERAEHARVRLFAAVEAAAECICIIDLDGRIRYVNPSFEEATGFPRVELVDRNLRELEAPEERPGREHPRWSAVSEGKRWRGRLVKARKDGARYPVDCSLNPIRDPENPRRTTEYVVLERDISHELLLEQRARQAHKMQALGTLAGGIAHDLNNILMPIVINAELLQEDLEQRDEQHLLSTKILTSARRGRDLVRQIVTFSRRREEERRPLEIAALLKESLELLRASLPTTIEIRKEFRIPQAIVTADPTQLHQVILNLCNNAAQAMDDAGGAITVGLDDVTLSPSEAARHVELAPGRYSQLTVRDTGPGVPVEVRDRIFEPFFTTKKPGEGAGMGLAVVHGIVSSHRGEIEVVDTADAGACFSVLLPMADRASSEPPPTASVPPRGKGTVLIVDDEVEILESISRVLERLGYQVVADADPVSALDSYQTDPKRFDVALLDQTMPKMTGLELADEIRARGPRIPIVICTGRLENVDRARATELGITELLVKPLSKAELGEAVARATRER